MEPTGGDVSAFIENVSPAVRRRDAALLLDLMERITGHDPVLWGTIIGFGSYHYRYPTGREGDAPLAAFSPRKPATTIYLAEGVGTYADALAKLGPHTSTVGCLYLKNLEDVDLDVLEGILRESFRAASSEGYGQVSHMGGGS